MTADGVHAQAAEQDLGGMARAWKEGYLQGLDTCFEWQKEQERLVKDSVKHGLSGMHQLVLLWRNWVDQTQASAVNPLLYFTKHSTEALVTTVEPILKTSEAAVESTFGYYQEAVAAPSREYVRDMQRQVLDVVVPAQPEGAQPGA